MLKIFLLFCLIYFWGGNHYLLQAQELVITKSITKTINVKNKDIRIDAEKADISITKSPNEYFEIKINFISKNQDKNVAEKQLDYLKYILNVKSKEVYLRNYILISAGEELTGIIEANYILKIPKSKTVTISNSLGNIKIENTEGIFELSTKYGNITLKQVKGKAQINSYIGEVLIKECNLNCELEANYVNSYFYDNSGNYKMKSNLGASIFDLNKTIQNLEINGTGTEITLLNKDYTEFNWNLVNQNGRIFLDNRNTPNTTYINVDSRADAIEKKEFIYTNPKISSTISVKNRYANISVQ